MEAAESAEASPAAAASAEGAAEAGERRPASRADAVIAAHYERWVTVPIPTLGGVSPLQAVRTPAGREQVAALVAEMERTGAERNPPIAPEVFSRMRKRLGLDEAG